MEREEERQRLLELRFENIERMRRHILRNRGFDVETPELEGLVKDNTYFRRRGNGTTAVWSDMATVPRSRLHLSIRPTIVKNDISAVSSIMKKMELEKREEQMKVDAIRERQKKIRAQFLKQLKTNQRQHKIKRFNRRRPMSSTGRMNPSTEKKLKELSRPKQQVVSADTDLALIGPDFRGLLVADEVVRDHLRSSLEPEQLRQMDRTISGSRRRNQSARAMSRATCPVGRFCPGQRSASINMHSLPGQRMKRKKGMEKLLELKKREKDRQQKLLEEQSVIDQLQMFDEQWKARISSSSPNAHLFPGEEKQKRKRAWQ